MAFCATCCTMSFTVLTNSAAHLQVRALDRDGRPRGQREFARGGDALPVTRARPAPRRALRQVQQAGTAAGREQLQGPGAGVVAHRGTQTGVLPIWVQPDHSASLLGSAWTARQTMPPVSRVNTSDPPVL